MKVLDKHTDAIAKIFEKEKDRYLAHKKAQPILQKMTEDPEVFFDIIRKNLLNKEFISKVRHYPTLAFEIFLDNNIGMNANVFMPLPDKSTTLSFQSIHHHGKLLLSTAAAAGPGYESILFKKGFTINPETKTAKMEIEKVYSFSKGSLDFIGSDQPHVVFFPTDVSITYTIWGYEKTTGLKEKLKNSLLVKKFKEPIRAALKMFRLSDAAGVNIVENLDFYPENGVLKVLKNRIEFEHGDNENFLTNVFHVMQKNRFADLEFLQKLPQLHPENKYLQGLVEKYISGEPIPSPFYDFHKNVPYVNLKKEDILSSVK